MGRPSAGPPSPRSRKNSSKKSSKGEPSGSCGRVGALRERPVAALRRGDVDDRIEQAFGQVSHRGSAPASSAACTWAMAGIGERLAAPSASAAAAAIAQPLFVLMASDVMRIVSRFSPSDGRAATGILQTNEARLRRGRGGSAAHGPDDDEAQEGPRRYLQFAGSNPGW